jgi:hypothetical protein
MFWLLLGAIIGGIWAGPLGVLAGVVITFLIGALFADY